MTRPPRSDPERRIGGERRVDRLDATAAQVNAAVIPALPTLKVSLERQFGERLGGAVLLSTAKKLKLRAGWDAVGMATRSSRRRSRSRADTRWLLAGYAGVAGFFALEAVTRTPGKASSLEASSDDQGTTRMIVAAYALGTELPLALRRVLVPQLPRIAGPVGLALQVSGLALRAWSMRTLGTSYTRTLRTESEQRLVDTGPYRLVRHPGYTGSLLTWTGFALTSRSTPVIVVVSALLGRAYYQRIAAEERLLLRDLPGYTAYSQRTNRLVPFVW